MAIYELGSSMKRVSEGNPDMIGRAVKHYESRFPLGDGVIVGLGRFGYEVIFPESDYKSLDGAMFDCLSPIARIKIDPSDDRVRGAEEIAFLKEAKLIAANNRAEAAKKAAEEKKAAEAALIKKLESEAEIKIRKDKRGYPMPGANLKKLVKKAYPDVNVRVRSDYNSIDVYVDDEVSPEVLNGIKSIALKFKAGNFNGMEDIYEYDNSVSSNAWAAVYGSANYVFIYNEKGYL